MILLLAVLFITVDEKTVFGQGCAMCQEAARAQSSQGVRALNLAIVLLLVPPVTIMGGLLVWIFKYKNDPYLFRAGATRKEVKRSKLSFLSQ